MKYLKIFEEFNDYRVESSPKFLIDFSNHKLFDKFIINYITDFGMRRLHIELSSEPNKRDGKKTSEFKDLETITYYIDEEKWNFGLLLVSDEDKKTLNSILDVARVEYPKEMKKNN